MMAYIEKGKVELKSSHGKSIRTGFRVICEDMREWKHHAVLDGEMVVVREDGISHFNSLENWYGPNDGELRYYVFDILYLGGESLSEVPLLGRTEILRKNFPKSKMVCFNDHFPASMGIDLTSRQINSNWKV